MIIVIISNDNRNHHPFKMSDEVQTASQGCHCCCFLLQIQIKGWTRYIWYTHTNVKFLLQIQIKGWTRYKRLTQTNVKFFYRSKSRGEQDTRETEMLILKVKGTARSRIMKPNQYRHLFCFESMKNYIATFVKSHIK